MNAYENGVIKYQIDLERYKNGIANEVIQLLDNANIEIAGYIKKTQSVATKARYKQIAKKLNEISKQLKERIGQDIDVDAVIAYELKKENNLFEKIKQFFKGDKIKIDFKFPSVEQIKTSALFRPATDGLTFQSYLDSIEAGLFNTWDSAVRTGYLTGIPTKQIVSNVMGGVSQIDKLKKAGTLQPFRNNVYANTRTLLQSFAEEARERVYKENEQYFGDGEYKYEYLATLDNRTCLPKGEKVLTPTGYKNIEEIQKGDIVIGGSGEERKVTGTLQKQADELIEIELENGKIIRCTPDHLILTERGWIEAGDLIETDVIKESL